MPNITNNDNLLNSVAIIVTERSEKNDTRLCSKDDVSPEKVPCEKASKDEGISTDNTDDTKKYSLNNSDAMLHNRKGSDMTILSA